MTEPEEDAEIAIANEIIDFILNSGAHKKIMVRSQLIAAILDHIFEICDFKLEVSQKLKAADQFLREFHRMQY